MTVKSKELKRALLFLMDTVDNYQPGRYFASLLYAKKGENGRFFFTTGNYGAASEVDIRVKDEPEEFLCSFNDLFAFAALAPDEAILTLYPLNEGGVYVSYYSYSITIPQTKVIPPKQASWVLVEFPDDEEVEYVDIMATIPPHVYRAASDDTPPITQRVTTNGIFFDFQNGQIVGSDTARLGIGKIPKLDREGIILPKWVVYEGEDIRITAIGKGVVEFVTKNSLRRVEVEDKQYIDYKKKVSLDFKGEVKFNGWALKEALRGKEVVEVKLSMNTMTITDLNTGAISMLACNYKPNNPYVFRADAEFMTDAVSWDKKGSVLKVNSSNKPFMIDDTVVYPIIPPSHEEWEIVEFIGDTFPVFVYTRNPHTDEKDPQQLITELETKVAILKKERDACRHDLEIEKTRRLCDEF